MNVVPALRGRNRLTAFFRFFLAIPHLFLVGGPAAIIGVVKWMSDDHWSVGIGSGSGLLGLVACLVAACSWFVILFTGRNLDGLRRFAAFYLRWRVRANAYMTLLRDEYPPFGDRDYPAELVLTHQEGKRNRLTVLFRFFLAIPHFFVLAVLNCGWALTTAIAWIFILVTGRYPETLYGFAIGVLAWGVRVEAYLLLLRDEYPPFTLRA